MLVPAGREFSHARTALIMEYLSNTWCGVNSLEMEKNSPDLLVLYHERQWFPELGLSCTQTTTSATDVALCVSPQGTCPVKGAGANMTCRLQTVVGARDSLLLSQEAQVLCQKHDTRAERQLSG